MYISSHYVVVEKIEEPKKEGFETVEVQDSFTYKGKVIKLPECPVYVDNSTVKLGDIVMFAKYSPDTHEVDSEGRKVKFIKHIDILAII